MHGFGMLSNSKSSSDVEAEFQQFKARPLNKKIFEGTAL
jgi:hypothetical protein